MLRRYRLWLALALLMAGLLCSAGGAAAQAGTVIRIRPAGGTYTPGQTFTAEVRIENVTALYGVDIQVTFDATRLEVIETSVTPGTDLLSPPWMVLFNQVDNEAGTIWYVATLLNPHAPVSGSGMVFSFHFRALESGLASANISEQTLSDINGELIPATTAGAIYGAGNHVFLPLLLNRNLGSAQVGGAAGGSVPHDLPWQLTGGKR